MTYKLTNKNIFTAYELIDKINLMRINSLINKYHNKTLFLQSSLNPAFTMIIHKSTKVEGYQASFFKTTSNELIAMSDIHRATFEDLINEIYHNYKQYKIKEVI